MRIYAMGIPVLGSPGGIVKPGRVHDKCVVILPVAHRVTVISRVECVFPAPAHGGRQRPPVRPDFAPDIHVLDQYERPIRQRRDRHSANFVRHVLRKSKRITISVMRIVRAGGTIFADRLVLIVQLFPQRSERWRRGVLRVYTPGNRCARARSCPGPSEIALRRWPTVSNGPVHRVVFPRGTRLICLFRLRLGGLGDSYRRENHHRA